MKIMRLGAGFLAAASVAVVTACGPASSATVPNQAAAAAADGKTLASVTVVGHGSAFAKPDTARLSIGVTVHRGTVVDSMNAASALQSKVLAAVQGAGVAQQDIVTDSIYVSEHWEFGSKNGYDASQSANIAVRDLSKVSAVVSAATHVATDSSDIGGITFSRDETASLLPAIRQSAMASAKSAADAWAGLNKCTVGGVTSISEVISNDTATVQQHNTAGQGGAGGSGGGVPVEPGRAQIQLDVQVSYAMAC